jgi:hypothetical protein
MSVPVEPLITALQGKLQVTLTYEKKTTGEVVTHTGGIYEIGSNKQGVPVLWLWDTTLNDNIRQFLLSNIIDAQVLDVPFQTNGLFPLKLNGQVIGQ